MGRPAPRRSRNRAPSGSPAPPGIRSFRSISNRRRTGRREAGTARRCQNHARHSRLPSAGRCMCLRISRRPHSSSGAASYSRHSRPSKPAHCRFCTPLVDLCQVVSYPLRELYVPSEIMRHLASLGYGPSGAHSGSLVVCEPADVFASPSHRRVLLVDDDVASLETWALLLADEGVQVEVAPSAEACLRIAGERPFDLVVIDFRLGDDSGLDVVRRLRARGNTVPFVLVTGHATIAMTVDA